MTLPDFPGWHLLGSFPAGEPDDVGSWLLHHAGEAALLEVPPGVLPKTVRAGLRLLGAKLRYAIASHDHEDHLDADTWAALVTAFPKAEFFHPSKVAGDQVLHLGGEPVWLVNGPKHSRSDVITIFRGVAMTGDVEVGMLESVNREVPVGLKQRSMAWFRGFEGRHGYQVHSVVSAHLNDVRVGVRWADLFEYQSAVSAAGQRTQCRRYGCWKPLVRMVSYDPVRLGTGFDMVCESCGCPDWSDPRMK